MVREIYIIHESGICLFARTFHRKESQDFCLNFSGFIIAISGFTQTMLLEEIQEIKMENTKIIFDMKDSLLIALVISDLRFTKRKLSELIDKIRNAFTFQYEDYLIQEILEPSLYNSFNKTLDNLLKKKLMPSQVSIH